MQRNQTRRSNRARTEATRSALLAAARELFVEKGYADTGTPEIVAAANVTRGALYHHFTDKVALFRAVVVHEAKAVADQIKSEAADSYAPLTALLAGAEAYFNAMAVPGRARLMLIEGPAVLGHAEMIRIDQETGGAELLEGLKAGAAKGALDGAPLHALADILSAAFDRAALAIAEGEPAADYKRATAVILSSLLAKTGQGTGTS